jgi:phospholipase/lecithinase/hemolysin
VKRSLIAAVAALSISAGQALAASPYTGIYAFGDSLSDVGNLLLYSSQPGSAIPEQPISPYSQGRFTNGNVWVQDLSSMLGLGPVTRSLLGGNDYAFGGATTGTTPAHTATAIDLPSQIAAFQEAHPTAPSRALYTLSIGANDLFAALESGSTLIAGETVEAAADNLANAALDLYDLGARDLVLFDVPDLGVTPAFNTSPYKSLATELAASFNADVASDLATMVPGLTVYDLNTFALVDKAVGPPQSPDFTNVTDPCWTGTASGGISSGTLCSDTVSGQDRYLFWDDVHPTAAGHLLVAEDARYLLTGVVPEPSTWTMIILGFAGLGALGRASARRDVL